MPRSQSYWLLSSPSSSQSSLLAEGIRRASQAAHDASVAAELFSRAEAGRAAEAAKAAAGTAEEARREAEAPRSLAAEPPTKRFRRTHKSAP